MFVAEIEDDDFRYAYADPDIDRALKRLLEEYEQWWLNR
jgi:hypothetical protein